MKGNLLEEISYRICFRRIIALKAVADLTLADNQLPVKKKLIKSCDIVSLTYPQTGCSPAPMPPLWKTYIKG